MMTAWKIIWRIVIAVGVFGSWVGIFYLAKDVSEGEQALQAWVSLVPFDRETALLYFSFFLVLWVVWIDLRPILIPLIRKHLPWTFKESGRITLVEFSGLATGYGWNFEGNSLQSLDLVDGLRQAAIDGDLIIEGRVDADQNNKSAKSSHPIAPIRGYAFVYDWIDVPSHFVSTDNFLTRTYRPAGHPEVRACDLYISSALDAHQWLEGKGRLWKGKRERLPDTRKGEDQQPQQPQGTQ